MMKRSTQVPNCLFDNFLPLLKESELKVLLVIIRQTNGWIDKRTGRRKTRDRITQSQFRRKTGLSKRGITLALQSLIDRGLIKVTDRFGNKLETPGERKGQSYLFYSLKPAQNLLWTSAKFIPRPAQISYHNKTNIQN